MGVRKSRVAAAAAAARAVLRSSGLLFPFWQQRTTSEFFGTATFLAIVITRPTTTCIKCGIMAVAQGRGPIIKKLHFRRALVASSLTSVLLVTCGFLSLRRLGGAKSTPGILPPTAIMVASATVEDPDFPSDVPTFVCPRCEDLFSRLDVEKQNQTRGDQEVRIRLRGEPKVGRT